MGIFNIQNMFKSKKIKTIREWTLKKSTPKRRKKTRNVSLLCNNIQFELADLSNTLSFHSQSLHLGEVVVICHHIGDD